MPLAAGVVVNRSKRFRDVVTENNGWTVEATNTTTAEWWIDVYVYCVS